MVIYVIGHKQINNFKLPKYEEWAGQIKMTRVNIRMTSRVFRMDTTVDNKTTTKYFIQKLYNAYTYKPFYHYRNTCYKQVKHVSFQSCLTFIALPENIFFISVIETLESLT